MKVGVGRGVCIISRVVCKRVRRRGESKVRFKVKKRKELEKGVF